LESYSSLKSQDVKFLKTFLQLFLEKRPIIVKFSKYCYESFHRNTDRRVMVKFRDIWPTGNRWNRALLTSKKQNFAWLSSCRCCADCALYAMASKRQCTQTAPHFI